MIKSAGLAAAMLLISFPALSADGVYTMDELKKTYIPSSSPQRAASREQRRSLTEC